jgi:hypothetical protein
MARVSLPLSADRLVEPNALNENRLRQAQIYNYYNLTG